MTDRCAQCLTEVPEGLGYRTPRDETLCGPCYFALWGPRARQNGPPTEEQRPRSRRRAKRRLPWLVPGPTGDVDPVQKIRNAHRRGRG